MISIIIPTLNEENYLPKLLDAIKRQSFQDFEIIVSDGFSKDKTLEVAKRYGCRVFEGEKNKRHPSIQRNNGAKIAKGNILLFLDADTSLPNNKFLETTFYDFKKRKLGVAGFIMDFKSKRFFYRFYYGVYNGLAFLAQYIRPVAVGAGIIIKKDLHEAIGGFDESIFIGEDQVYCEKASKKEKFRIIKKTKTYFSIRRFEKVGPWRMFGKLVYSAIYVLVFGPIRKKIVEYDFGNFK